MATLPKNVVHSSFVLRGINRHLDYQPRYRYRFSREIIFSLSSRAVLYDLSAQEAPLKLKCGVKYGVS